MAKSASVMDGPNAESRFAVAVLNHKRFQNEIRTLRDICFWQD